MDLSQTLEVIRNGSSSKTSEVLDAIRDVEKEVQDSSVTLG